MKYVRFLLLCALAAAHGLVWSQAITEYPRFVHAAAGQPPCTTGGWTCIGPVGEPASMSRCIGCAPGAHGTGQMHQIRFSPHYTRDSTAYACSNFGGLWKSTNRGASWSCLNTDTQLPFSSVSDVAIDPTDTRRLYMATGEANRTLGHYSVKHDGTPSFFTPLFTTGVYRSTDGGQRWTPINGIAPDLLGFLEDGGAIRQICLHPQRPERLFVVSSAGIFVTNDATVEQPVWTHITPGIRDKNLSCLVFKSGSTDTLYASGTDIYRSTDSGASWHSMTGTDTGLEYAALPGPFTVGRIGIAVTPAAPEHLYAYVVGTAPSCAGKAFIYRFNGQYWREKYAFCGRGGTTAVASTRIGMAVSPTDTQQIYFGGTIVWGSKNMDKNGSFSAVSPYLEAQQFHADVFALAFEPGANALWAATDGGIHKKNVDSPGTNGWTSLNDGLAIATVYRFDDTDDRTDRIMMGTQDCGTIVFTEADGWKNIYGGDGYNGKIDGVTGMAFGCSNGCNFFLVYDFNQKRLEIEDGTGSHPTDPQERKRAMVRPTFDMINHPASENMIFSMTEIYERLKTRKERKDNAAQLWKIRSDVGKSTYDQWKRQLHTFDIAPSNPDYMYVVQNGGVNDSPVPGEGFGWETKLFRSVTGGCIGEQGTQDTACFTDITNNLLRSGIRSQHYQPQHLTTFSSALPVITGVLFHPENHLKAWITFTGYEPGVKIWATNDGGETWYNADPTGSLHNLPVNDLVFQAGSDDRLYLGTDAGIWFKDNAAPDWQPFCDFPRVRVTELKINYCMGKLRASTFGRSIWEADLLPSDGTLGELALVISETPAQPWTMSRGLDRNLRLKKGVTLRMEGPSPDEKITISMPKNGRIIVEEGAQLILSNVILTNNCGNTWKGIELVKKTRKKRGKILLSNAAIERAEAATTTIKK